MAPMHLRRPHFEDGALALCNRAPALEHRALLVALHPVGRAQPHELAKLAGRDEAGLVLIEGEVHRLEFVLWHVLGRQLQLVAHDHLELAVRDRA